jgi:hypothetical protein
MKLTNANPWQASFTDFLVIPFLLFVLPDMPENP